MNPLFWAVWAAVALAVLAWAGTQESARALVQQVMSTGPWAPLVAALGLLASHGCRASRLHGEWSPRRGVSWLECLRVSLLHTAAVNLAPFRSGELGYPLLLRRRWGVPLGEAAGSLLWLRVQDAVVLAWLLALTVCAGLADRPEPGFAGLGMLGVVVATAAFLSLMRLGPVAADPGVPSAVGPFTWRRVWQVPLRALRQASPASWMCSALNWILKLGALGLLFSVWSACGPQASWRAALAGELAMALPVQAPAGFGSLEAAMALGARTAAEHDLGSLLAAALGVHLFALAVSLGAALWAASPNPGGRPASRFGKTG